MDVIETVTAWTTLRWAAAAIPLWVSCVVPGRLLLPVPEADESGRALLLAAVGRSVRYFAYALPRDTPLDPPLLEVEDQRFEAAVFSRTLAELGLEAGEVAPREGDTGPFTGFSALFFASTDQDGLTSWRGGASPGPALSAFRLPSERGPCQVLTYDVVGVETPSRVLFAEPVAPGEVLLVDEGGRAFRVTREGAEPIVIRPEEVNVRAIHQTAEETWVSYRSRGRTRIGRGTLGDDELTLEAVSTTTADDVRAIAKDAFQNRFIGLAPQGRLVEYRRNDFEHLGTFDSLERRGSLAQADDGRWLAVLERSNFAFELDGDDLVMHQADSQINVVTLGPDGELLAGAESGAVYQLDGERLVPWAQLDALGVRTLVSYPRGVIAGVEGGQVSVLEDGVSCPPALVLSEFPAPAVYRAFDTTVVVSVANPADRNGRPVPVAFLDLE